MAQLYFVRWRVCQTFVNLFTIISMLTFLQSSTGDYFSHISALKVGGAPVQLSFITDVVPTQTTKKRNGNYNLFLQQPPCMHKYRRHHEYVIFMHDGAIMESLIMHNSAQTDRKPWWGK